ncbi:MAG: hypothetical protein M0R49_08905, partial [Limnochordia bacterium]|nr:hypothetical protein [Limnochordia bacterium]
AGLLAIVYTAIVLVLDHATVFSTLKYIRTSAASRKRGGMRRINPLSLLGGTLGSVILVSVYYLSRSGIPFLSWPFVSLLGFSLGVIITLLADRFSPVNSMELMAGQCLGLSNVQIMREVVIPSSRPGLLNLLNRFKQQF